MAQEKLSFEQFLNAANEDDKTFVQNLHNYLLDNGCKATFEEKKTSLLGSYKHTKSKKAVINLFIRKQGLFVRIYGENISEYPDFLDALPEEMTGSIEGAGICTRLVNNACSPKCKGYDFTIRNERFQKCRYGGFEFLATKKNIPYIKTFVENEATARQENFVV